MAMAWQIDHPQLCVGFELLDQTGKDPAMQTPAVQQDQLRTAVAVFFDMQRRARRAALDARSQLLECCQQRVHIARRMRRAQTDAQSETQRYC
jgi:hypothetical protein